MTTSPTPPSAPPTSQSPAADSLAAPPRPLPAVNAAAASPPPAVQRTADRRQPAPLPTRPQRQESSPTRGLAPGDRPIPLTPPGPQFAVRDVAPSDVLYIRAAPGPNNAVVGQIPPDTHGIVGTGARQKVGSALWYEVIHDGVQGWVNARFLVAE